MRFEQQLDPPYQEPPPHPHCGKCGGFLRWEPDVVGGGEAAERCSGEEDEWGRTACGDAGPHAGHSFVVWGWTTETRVCRRCKAANEIVV